MTTTFQINFENSEQVNKLLLFLHALKVNFKFTKSGENYDFSETLAAEDVHHPYKSSMKVLSEDWDNPEDDHWDAL